MSEREKTLEQLVEQRTERLRAEVERAREEGRRAGLECPLCEHVAHPRGQKCGHWHGALEGVCGCRAMPEDDGLDTLPPDVEADAVERAWEEGRRAGLEEASSEALGWADPDSAGAEAFVRLAETLRARAAKPSTRVEAFEVPSAGVAGLLHSGVPLEGAHKLGTNSDGTEDASVTSESGDWYCPTCKMYVSARSVTFAEVHEVCQQPVVWHDVPWHEGAPCTSSDDVEQAFETVRGAMSLVPRDGGQWTEGMRALSTLERTLADLRAEAARVDDTFKRTMGELDQSEKERSEFRTRAKQAETERDEANKRTLEMCAVQEAEMQARLRAEADNAALLKRLRMLEQESVPKARVLEVLDAVENEPTQVDGFTADEQGACDTGWGGAVRAVRESLGLNNEETRR